MARLRPKLWILIVLFGIGLLAGCRPAERPAQTTPALPLVHPYDETPAAEAPLPEPVIPPPPEKNEKEEKAIETGFFFKDGVYVPPPYVVEVAEGGVSINGLWVREPPGPLPERNILRVPKEDPGPFKWTPELLAKGFTQDGFDRNACLRFLYWQSQYGFDEACNRFEAYLKEQPLVVRTERLRHGIGGGFSIRYWMKNGREDGYSFLPPGGRRAPTEKEREATLQRIAQMYRETLAREGAILKGRAETLLPSGGAAKAVVRMFDIVNSPTSDEARATALMKEGPAYDPKDAKNLVIGLKHSPALKERVDKVRIEMDERE